MPDPSEPARPRWHRSLVVAAVFVFGLLAYHAALQLGGRVVVDRTTMELLEQQVQRLEEENNQLFEELFSPKPDYDPLAADIPDELVWRSDR